MAAIEITKKEFGSTPTSDTSFLVVQPEVPEGEEAAVDSLRRQPPEAIAELLKEIGEYVDVKALQAKYGSIISDIESIDTGLRVTWMDGKTQDFTVATQGGGIAFDTGYQDSNGYIHLTLDGQDIEGFDPFLVSGGGGSSGGGSKLTFAVYTASVFSIMESTGSAIIQYKFASVDTDTGTETGGGNLAVKVGGVTKSNQTISQGDNLTVDVFQYLANGTNSVQLVITDSYLHDHDGDLLSGVESGWNCKEYRRSPQLLCYSDWIGD